MARLSDLPANPVRLRPSEAAEAMRVGVGTLYTHWLDSEECYFSLVDLHGMAVHPGDRAKGRRIYLLPDEVELAGTQGRAALLAYRLERGRISKPEYKRLLALCGG